MKRKIGYYWVLPKLSGLNVLAFPEQTVAKKYTSKGWILALWTGKIWVVIISFLTTIS